MARKIRLFFDDVSQYIVLKGINQENIFRDQEDFSFYKGLLEGISGSLHVRIHAYCLLSKEIHLLATFASKEALSRFMQSLSLKYISYFNKKHKRKGTLWEGRYKSSPVEDKYLLQVMQYIESAPIREKVVKELDRYLYSSYQKNAQNQDDKILVPHDVYILFGKDDKDRANIYKSRFSNFPLYERALKYIYEAINRQEIIGTFEFIKKLEKSNNISLFPKKRGRPKKIRKKGQKMNGKLVVLDKVEHKSLKVSPLENLDFAKELSFVPLLANEVALVGEMFPVVFSSDETPSLLALTSLGGENLAINSEGKYISRYVPAYLRKYPFALASTKEDPEKRVILFDENASNISKTKGNQLFTKDGQESEVLKKAVQFLTDYEKQSMNTAAIVKTIVESGILEPREISVGEGEEKKVLVKGFQVASRKKLNELDDETLALWVRKGIISFLDAHINSLSKVETLFKIANQNQKSEN